MKRLMACLSNSLRALWGRWRHDCPAWYECTHRDYLGYRFGCDLCPGHPDTYID